eukprot:XP_011601910.1 PREDICTED: TANK-binding kinase 1-binding protein 1-like [Takifugu rubripes]
MMDLFRRGELGLLGGGEGLRDDVGVSGISWSANRLSEDVYPASGLALAAAYHDIKTRLASLERENSSIKRKLKHYEVKFPMISEFGEERILCCSCDSIIKDTSVIQSETTNLQQRVNSLTQELQKSKEREERLEEVIQAYEKIHLEKSNVQRDLDKMTTLAEQHMERICSLESALRQRETSLQKLSAQLRSKDAHQSQLHASLDGRGPTLQSSRSLDALSDLKLQRLEAELEGARHQAEGACQREKELRVELQRLQQEVAQLQEAQSQSQELPAHCEHCDVEWIKKAGDEQVNLALAYTELTEELGRVRGLAITQSDLLRQVSQEPVSDPSAVQRAPARLMRDPVSTLPKPRSLLGEMHGYGQTKAQLRTSLVGLDTEITILYTEQLIKHEEVKAGNQKGGHPDMEEEEATFVHHFCHLDNQPEPTPLVTPPQSSDDEEDVCAFLSPLGSPPQTLGAIGISSSSPREHSICPSFPSPRKQPHHPSFSAPEGPATLSCHLPPYMNTEHAQSWPSINLWMESEESTIRSCPLCQLTFPTGYPDDALIKHIDSHLENSKI